MKLWNHSDERCIIKVTIEDGALAFIVFADGFVKWWWISLACSQTLGWGMFRARKAMLGPNANILQIVLFKKTEKQKTQEGANCLLSVIYSRISASRSNFLLAYVILRQSLSQLERKWQEGKRCYKYPDLSNVKG